MKSTRHRPKKADSQKQKKLCSCNYKQLRGSIHYENFLCLLGIAFKIHLLYYLLPLRIRKQPPEVFYKKGALKISQNFQENTCAGASFLI